MRKYLTICSALLALGLGSAHAQQREAVLHRIDIPNTNFYLVIATPKAGAAPVDYRGMPDTALMYLAGGELVHGYDSEMQRMFPALASTLSPALALHVEQIEGQATAPVAVYLVPRDEAWGPPMQ